MKSCGSNSTAAYSRRVRTFGTARRAVFANGRDRLLRRWFFRLALIFCASLCFAIVSPASPGTAVSARRETPTALASPQQTGSSQSSPSASKTPEQARTEQYTLSHDRQAKAMAYSRAGYTLYFVSYFLGGLYLFLILRLGWAAKFRDIAENVTDKKWVQGLVFVPLLFLTIAALHLPLRIYWHALSLHYGQSVQAWGSWFWDWTKSELLSM